MIKRNKIMFIFGTRPEAIKLMPIINRFRDHGDVFESLVVATAQHREILDQILDLFQIKPDYDLSIMRENQSLEGLTSRCLIKLSEVIKSEKPKMILVQGDTTTTFIGALASYYFKIPVGHIEAGLRSYDKFQPFPEEINRKLTTVLTDIHFAPTKLAAENLRSEGISPRKIFITGNTVIDTLLKVSDRKYKFKNSLGKILNDNSRLILVTAHRRESFGKPLANICAALEQITQSGKDIKILYPVHPNPHVGKTINQYINNNENIHLVPPLDYETFVHVMKKSHLILTDSGGIQEEAPSLGKPVLVLRNKTERKEGIEAGTAKLVGTNIKKILSETLRLLTNQDEYEKMAKAQNPYGDGKASERIFDIICKKKFPEVSSNKSK